MMVSAFDVSLFSVTIEAKLSSLSGNTSDITTIFDSFEISRAEHSIATMFGVLQNEVTGTKHVSNVNFDLDAAPSMDKSKPDKINSGLLIFSLVTSGFVYIAWRFD